MDLSSWTLGNITEPLNLFLSETVPVTIEQILGVVVMAFLIFGFFFIIRPFVRW